MNEAQFQQTAKSFLSWYMERSPVMATEMGVHTWDHRLTDFRSESLQITVNGLEEYLSQLNQFDFTAFSTTTQIDYTMVVAFIKSELREYRALTPHLRNPGLYVGEIFNGIFSLILTDFAPWPQRFAALLSRISNITVVLAAAKENIVADQVPRIWAEIAMDQVKMAPVLFTEILPALGAAPTERETLTTAGREAVEQFAEFGHWLEQEILPRANGSFAVGSQLFDTLLRENHMVDYDSEELLATGWRLFEETKEQLQQLTRGIDAAKTAEEIIAAGKRRHPSAPELLNAVREAMEAARDFTLRHDIATIPEGEILDVVETPLFLRPIIPIAAYIPPGAFSDNLAGVFMVTPPETDDPEDVAELKLRAHNYGKLPVTALHEAYPGHHLQLVQAARSELLAGKLGMFLSTLFIEGWAFYCEEMMEATGFIREPEQRLSRLHDQLWRAARIILDVSLHCKGMNTEEAVDFFVTRCGLERTHAEAEIRRYTLSPTQPQSYLMGKLEILKVVGEYKERFPAHSLKQMHDALLAHGSLPPKLLRKALFS